MCAAAGVRDVQLAAERSVATTAPAGIVAAALDPARVAVAERVPTGGGSGGAVVASKKPQAPLVSLAAPVKSARFLRPAQPRRT